MPDLSIYSKKNEPLWKISKNYSSISLPNDSTSLGMSIDVYIDSIGKTTEEWLVNFQYLDSDKLYLTDTYLIQTYFQTIS